MTGRTKSAASKSDRLMDEASSALAQSRYCEAERLCVEALHGAHEALDYERMARILLPLQEARRLRRQAASDVKKAHRLASYADLEALLTGSKVIAPGCVLLEPPLVGADGRELRERAISEGAAVFVVVREPVTRAGEWPIVAVGPVTVRTRLEPPRKVDVAWMLRAGEALGDAALARVDPRDNVTNRVERLIELLAAVVDHEKLHEALRAACESAHHEILANPKKSPRGKARAAEPLDETDAEPGDDE